MYLQLFPKLKFVSQNILYFRHKPLGRTQSAPLPLGHPFLQQQNLLLQQQHSQQVKQHIRQAVLQRAGMENVDEETEAKLQQVRLIIMQIEN